MRLFDAYLAIDWSSRNAPSPRKGSKDAIWLGEAHFENDGLLTVHDRYERTRKACIDHLIERLRYYKNESARVFVGFDFAYGYPKGYATALGFGGSLGQAWRYIWDELAHLIVDEPDNKNNRFEVAATLNARCEGIVEGPMWGCPVGKISPHLKCTAPHKTATNTVSLEEYRVTDARNKGAQSVWKLFYTGSVGGQSLVGIPAVRSLRDHPDLAAFSRVWPFETGFTPTPTPSQGAFILHAEIWPGVIGDPVLDGRIRDQAQVRGIVEWLAKLDSAGELGTFFDSPDGLSVDAEKGCVEEEGWIIGSGFQK